jgi:hypothetical protein
LHSSLKGSLVFLIVSLILIFVFGILHGFSHDGVLSPFGYALALFVTFSLLFLVLFGLDYFFNAWRLESNTWVADVKEMDFLFNPMYWTWVFYHDHKKWASWNTLFSFVLTVLFGIPIWLVFTFILYAPPTMPWNSWTNSWTGWAIATALMGPLAFSWYLYYTSVDRTPSPFPKGRLSDLPRRL